VIDIYKTIEKESIGEYKDKGSKFIAYAVPLLLHDIAPFAVFLEKLKKEHPKARHFCYAWRSDTEGVQFRANDDGEPSGTAGKPILGQIDSFGLTCVAVVVVRYFGGTLLGTSGLITAYRESAADALSKATIVERVIDNTIVLTFGYALMPDVMTALKKMGLPIKHQNFEENCTIQTSIRLSETADRLLQLKASVFKMSVEEYLFNENKNANYAVDRGLTLLIL
jgi:uncharacterized YigZ family protein